MSEELILTEEQQWALRGLLSGRNLFLTGKAGTGKSTVLLEFRKRTQRVVAFLAPTGIAARNLGGETCHRFFGLKALDALMPEQLAPLDDKRREILRRVETIVIDEVSMLRSDCLYAIDQRLRDANRVNLPFGGKQIVFCGDFCQLPPVVRPVLNFDLSEWMLRNFGGAWAFQTGLWREAKVTTIVLHQVMRQKDDWFLERLNAIRYGAPAELGTWLSSTNQVLCKDAPEGESIIELCTRNADAERLNRQALKGLPGKAVRSQAVISGYFPWREHPTDTELKLKVGLRVMLLRNQNRAEDSYVNGDLGVILQIDNPPQGQPRVTVRLDRGSVITVGEHWGYSLEYDDDEGKRLTLKREESFTQLPLRAAYAISIHKSQGMTFDRLKLQLGSGCFASGQLYTALSRCRTAAGIYLSTPITASDIICSPEVVDAYRKWDFSEKMWLEILTRHLDELPDEDIGIPSVLALNWTEAFAFPVLACLQKAYGEYCRRSPQECDGEPAECGRAESVWARLLYYALGDTWLNPAELRMLVNQVRLLKYRYAVAA